MLHSMTGYGKATATFSHKKINVEIRSLNSKRTDIYLKVPTSIKGFEVEIQKLIAQKLHRGKIECFITEEAENTSDSAVLNEELVIAYHEKLKRIAEKVGETDTSGLLPAIMRLPNVMQAEEQEVGEEEWKQLQKLLLEALENITSYRREEGKSIVADFTNSVDTIEKLLQEVPKYEDERIEAVKERMQKSLNQLDEKADKNRFEQELIYYIEKLDVNEEKSRLQQHIDYFRTTMNSETEEKGKKLGFISQEMGREINTLGSKSYHADLQKVVVNMKNNLEKIKEQVLNTL